MFQPSKLAVATVVAAAALLASVGIASADRGIAVSETRIRGTSRGLTFRSTSEPAVTIICTNLTIAGTSTSTIAKVEGTRSGAITEFITSGCTTSGGGLVSFTTQNMPWPGYYVSFLGTLPDITGLKGRTTVRFGISYPFLGMNINCTYEGSVYGLSPVARGVISRGTILTEQTTVNYVAGSFLCPRTATLEGEGIATTPVTVTLI